ncbi:MAG: pesticidal protein Cry7Aa [Flavobacteriales bacterium]|nr:pesticidal protein Cry7Aa [Flavobacteriales bacterium]
MVEVNKLGVVLKKTQLGFESEGVLNPGVILVEGSIHMFYRAVAKGNYSSIGYCRLSDPVTVAERHDTPIFFPQDPHEVHGVEDARVVCIDGIYYMTYTAYDGVNALCAVAVSNDLKTWERKGFITPQVNYKEFARLAATKGDINDKYLRFNSPQGVNINRGDQVLIWDKDGIFFPRRIGGKLCFMHRIRPDLQIVCVDRLEDLTPDFWQKYLMNINDHILLAPRHKHEVSYVGGGCPPIETAEGWLFIYHGVCDTVEGYVYSACAALFDLENPQVEIARLPYPLFRPEFEWEMKGYVNNVCFPTGAVLLDDTLYIYYGAADDLIACASVSLSALLKELLNYRPIT